jgi:hypothetical protein
MGVLRAIYITLFALFPFYVFPATYYVDYTGGSETATGTSTGAAWKYCPGDSRFTTGCSNPSDCYTTWSGAGSKLNPGDTVIFKGGVTYTGTGTGTLITISNGGTLAGGYVTYRGNTEAGDWGTGKANFDLNETYGKLFYASNLNYGKILNFDITKAASLNTGNGQDAMSVVGTDSNIYTAKTVHTAAATNRPITGASWATYWDLAGASGSTWVAGKEYGPACTGTEEFLSRSGTLGCYALDGATGNDGVIELSGPCGNWTIQSNIFHEWQYWSDVCVADPETNPKAWSAVPSSNTAIYIHGTDEANQVNNVLIDSNEFYAIGDTAVGVRIFDDITVSNNNFGGINRDTKTGYFSVAIKPSSATTAGSGTITITGNTFHDGWQYQGDEAKQRCHAGDWIHSFAYADRPIELVDMERNMFYNDKAFSNANGTASGGQHDDFRTFVYRNNVCINPFGAGGCLSLFTGLPSNTSTAYIDNNTVIVYGTGSSGAINPSGMKLLAGTSDTAFNLYLRNNIFINYDSYAAAAAISMRATGSNAPPIIQAMDNNVYNTPNAASHLVGWYGANTYDFAAWQTLWAGDGFDVNAANATPTFTSVPATGATSSSADLTLQAGDTTAKNKGIDLSASFTVDYTNTTRVGDWEVGAYDAGAGGDVTAPTVSVALALTFSSNLTATVSAFTCADETALSALPYCLVETNDNSGCTWEAAKPATHTWTAYGYKSLYGFCRDAAGNISTVSTATVSLPWKMWKIAP